MRIYFILGLLASLLLGCSSNEDQIKLNEIQLIGSHNSYKKKMHPALWEAIYVRDSITAMELDYGHLP